MSKHEEALDILWRLDDSAMKELLYEVVKKDPLTIVDAADRIGTITPESAIRNGIRAGRSKIDMIKDFRQATGCSLSTANKKVAGMMDDASTGTSYVAFCIDSELRGSHMAHMPYMKELTQKPGQSTTDMVAEADLENSLVFLIGPDLKTTDW